MFLLLIITIVHIFSAYKAGKNDLSWNFRKKLLILSCPVFLFSFGSVYVVLSAGLNNNAGSIAFAKAVGTTVGCLLLYALPTALSFWIGKSTRNKNTPSP